MKKTILLTGGTGFVGSHLLDRLCLEGHEVFLLTQETSHLDRIDHLVDQYTSVYFSDLSQLFESKKIDLVIHLATCYKKEHSAEDIEKMVYANVTLPTKILELCKRHNIKKFINTGTFFEYDIAVSEFSENTPEQAYNLYASLKLAFNSVLQYYANVHAMNIITLRIFSPYGPKDNIKIVPILIEGLLQNNEISLQDTSQTLHFTFISDIIDAYIATIEYISDSAPIGYEVINIGSEQSYSIEEIINFLQKISSSEIRRNIVIPYQSKIKSTCNIKKARDILNWQPKISLEEGLKHTYNYYNDAIHTNHTSLSL